jgi:hypothetical protein
MRVVVVAALVWVVVAVGHPFRVATIVAQSAAPARQAPSAAAPTDAATYRAWVNKYCVGCHNTRNPQPGNDPVNLESASLDNLLPHAATWERVLRKLSVRAMPPQGVPHPAEPEYVAFTTWLADSLDRAWAGRVTPGRYVVHRLNRVEYRNAIRDLLALDVDVSSLLPNDGGDFGFDNIATALRTSPLLLDGYLTAAQRISTLAVGDPEAPPGTVEYSINRDFSQNAYIEGSRWARVGDASYATSFPPTVSTSCSAGWSAASKRATRAWKAMTFHTRSSSRWMEPRCTRPRSVASRITRLNRRT